MRSYCFAIVLSLACVIFLSPVVMADTTPPLSMSSSGLTGLVRLPTADTLPDGTVQFEWFSGRAEHSSDIAGDSMGQALDLTFLPHVEIGVGLNAPQNQSDLIGNIKWQFLPASESHPALAGGVVDLKNGSRSPTYFLVATQHLLDGRISASVGGLAGHTHGVYGGIEAGILPDLSAVGEYNSKSIEYGARLSVFHRMFNVMAGRDNRGWLARAGITFPLSSVPKPPDWTAVPRASISDRAVAAATVQRCLTRMGLENVTVDYPVTPEQTMRASYENRSFAHSEMAALANVLAALAIYAPEDIQNLSVVSLREGMPITTFDTPVNSYRTFMDGTITREEFANDILVRFAAHRVRANKLAPSTGVSHLSYGKSDLAFRPGFRTEIGTEDYTLGVALSVQPELSTPIYQGLGGTVEANIPVGGTNGIRPYGAPSWNLQSSGTTVDRALLHYSMRPMDSGFLRGYVGKFPQQRDGAAAEALYFLKDPRWMAGVSGAILKREDGLTQHPVYSGQMSYYYPDLNITTSVEGAQFLNGDRGIGVNLTRRFGSTDIGLQFRDTNAGKIGSLFMQIPLGPDHLSQNPSWLRVRPGDYLQYTHSTSLNSPNLLSTVQLAAQDLSPGETAYRELLDYGQLNPAYILRSLKNLRNIRLFQILPLTIKKGQPSTP